MIQAAEKLSQGNWSLPLLLLAVAVTTAGYNYTWGFCYYNDVAMAVKRLQALGIEKDYDY